LAAFNMVNRDLENADTEQRRIQAIGRNHQLWSLLVRDLALESNGLPAPLRGQLIELGFWSMRYSIQATLLKLPVQPLLTVNRNIVEGLLAQKRPSGNGTNTSLGQPVAV